LFVAAHSPLTVRRPVSRTVSGFSISEKLIYLPRPRSRPGLPTVPWLPQEAYVLLGERLAEARREAGITQVELAARLRKPQSFVSAFERGQRRIDILEFLVVLDALPSDAPRVLGCVVAATEDALRLGRGRRPARR
jgi:Helix-turn-helix